MKIWCRRLARTVKKATTNKKIYMAVAEGLQRLAGNAYGPYVEEVGGADVSIPINPLGVAKG